MKPGDLVGWKHRMEAEIPSEFGIILERWNSEHDPFPFWKVVFVNRGVLQCRESDLMVVR